MTVLATPRRSTDPDKTGEESFPASDPPAVWTWDVEPAPSVAVDRQPAQAV
jgi:hypothetical protein